MPVDKRGLSINSERFRFSVLDLYIPPINPKPAPRGGRGGGGKTERLQQSKEIEIIRNLGRILFL